MLHPYFSRSLAPVLGLGLRLAPLAFCAATLPAQTLVNGGAIDGRISTPQDVDRYEFFAFGGEGFQLRVADLDGTVLYPRLTVQDPQGNALASNASYDVAALILTAPATGTYRVFVSDGTSAQNGTGRYRLQFTLAPGANEGGLLQSGGSVDGALSLGDLDSYTFDMNAGESYRLRLADLNATAMYPRITVYDPYGGTVAANATYDVPALGGVARYSGRYTVVVGDGNSRPTGTGAYRLHHVRVPGPRHGGVLPSGGSILDALELGEIDNYVFDATAGEAFLLRLNDVNATGMYPRIELFDPLGRYVAGHASYDIAHLAGHAAITGTYTVVVLDGNSRPTGTGAYDLHFARVPSANAGGVLQTGTSVTGRIDRGDLDTFTFNVRAGDTYALRLADVDATGMYPRLTVYDPFGAVAGANASYDVAAVSGVAVFNGTYTVVVADGNSRPAATGNYELHYVQMPTANEFGYLLGGQTVSERVRKGDLDTFTFRGRAGDVARLDLVDVARTGLYPWIGLYSPLGERIGAAAGYDGAVITTALPRDGVYTVLVADGNSRPAASGDYTLTLTGSGYGGGAGCSNEGPPQLDRSPSAATGFSVEAPQFQRTGIGPALVLIGSRASQPIPLPTGMGCGSCGIALSSVWLSAAGSVAVPPLHPSTVGAQFTAQAVGAAASGCLILSAARDVTVVR